MALPLQIGGRTHDHHMKIRHQVVNTKSGIFSFVNIMREKKRSQFRKKTQVAKKNEKFKKIYQGIYAFKRFIMPNS